MVIRFEITRGHGVIPFLGRSVTAGHELFFGLRVALH